MLLSVPTVTSRWRGTVAVRTPSGVSLANLTGLPFRLTSMKPADSSLRLTSRYGSGLRGTVRHIDLYGSKLGRNSGARLVET